MEPLKEMFNKSYYERLAKAVATSYNRFDVHGFVHGVTSDLENRSLNERLRNTSVILKTFLPDDFERSVSILYDTAPRMEKGYTALVFPDYVGLYGQQEFDLSMDALRFFTGFGSSEFAIRTFLKNDFDRTIKEMYRWAEDQNHHVRRLASEGSRPRLPWSFKLPQVIENPEVTRPILEKLNKDNELYVRKSVANHLNDFSKDNPDFMLKLVGKWDKSHPHTAWIVKHGTRTLIKKGNAASLEVFGFEKEPQLRLEDFSLNAPAIQLGEELVLSFDLVSEKASPQKLVVDYIVHYRKSTGDLSPKVFKLKEVLLQPSEKVRLTKKQRIQDFSTRKHYPGEHVIRIQVNGKVMGEVTFNLQIGTA